MRLCPGRRSRVLRGFRARQATPLLPRTTPGLLGRAPRLLADADAAFVNSGTTLNEALSAGVPVITRPQIEFERRWLDLLQRRLNLRLPRRLTAANLERVLNPSTKMLNDLERASGWFRNERKGAREMEDVILRIKSLSQKAKVEDRERLGR